MKNGRLMLFLAALLAALGWSPARAGAECVILSGLDFLVAGASEQRFVVEDTSTCRIRRAAADVLIPAIIEPVSQSAGLKVPLTAKVERKDDCYGAGWLIGGRAGWLMRIGEGP